jgi:hypothetical protein
MKTIYLKDFIKTGVFGDIVVGKSTKSDVISLMGPDFDFGDCGETHIIKYAWYEFFYWTDSEVVHGIQNDHVQFDCTNHDEQIVYANDQVKIDTWFLKVGQNIKQYEVIALLEQEGVSYELKKYDNDYQNDELWLTNGLTLDFDESVTTWVEDEDDDEWGRVVTPIEDPKDYILNGIRLFRFDGR